MNLTKSQKKWSYVWLALGSALLYFSNWNWAFPPATWLFSIFLLRFSRIQKKSIGLLALCIICIIVGVASMWKLLSIEAIPPSFRIASGIAVGVVFFLPFLIDRLLVSKLPGLFATLVFPFSWTAMEYLKSLENGSWGALAYTQYGNLYLMQLASITGLWGISFLITWLASIVNWAWEQQFAWGKIRKIILLYCVIIFSVFLYGYVRLATSETPTDNVCVASVTNPQDFFSRFYGPDWTDRKSATNLMNHDLEYFLSATRISAHAGANIVFWQEYAMVVMEENEQIFIENFKKIARDEQIYLGLAFGLFPLDYPAQKWLNKLVWIDPNGNVINEYFKLKPAPPLEPIAPGKGNIPILDTPYCKIGSVICADQDYPSYIRQAGVKDTSILLVPAQDWAAVDPLHSRMGVFRAIENGFSLVKGTGGGISVAIDPYGRIINSSNYPNSKHDQMISFLPKGRIETIYSRIGDVFGWLCVLGLLVTTLFGFFKKKPVSK